MKNIFGSDEIEAKIYNFNTSLYWKVINEEISTEDVLILMQDA